MSAFEVGHAPPSLWAPSRTPPPLQTPPPPDKPKNRGSSTAAFVLVWGKKQPSKVPCAPPGGWGEGRLLSTDTKSSGRGGPDCANAPQHGASTASHPSSEVDKQPDSTQALEKKKSQERNLSDTPLLPSTTSPTTSLPLGSPIAVPFGTTAGFLAEGKRILSVSFQAAGFLTLSPNGARAEQALSCWADWPPFQHDCGLTGPDIKFATISAEYGGTTSKQERAKKNRTWWEMQGLDRSSARGHRRQDMLLVAVLARLHRGRPNSFAFC
ncbi:hypothetical protein CCM_04021 [Cordyceps militaris CM01]|uniref:Uncharacterized protein n=1 Tax=Cordyceps militaris (strain CM01) TaxID=983644 RepID=G3JDH3_CORMM|nr:uncharacterized protein CCM_04021 [Cordyceps militaris CM01]EGX92648.1 hypothetical protein CCM_04021 [Cordyceps militaris CM01]